MEGITKAFNECTAQCRCTCTFQSDATVSVSRCNTYVETYRLEIMLVKETVVFCAQFIFE